MATPVTPVAAWEAKGKMLCFKSMDQKFKSSLGHFRLITHTLLGPLQSDVGCAGKWSNTGHFISTAPERFSPCIGANFLHDHIMMHNIQGIYILYWSTGFGSELYGCGLCGSVRQPARYYYYSRCGDYDKTEQMMAKPRFGMYCTFFNELNDNSCWSSACNTA